jgi:hypothetical protein
VLQVPNQTGVEYIMIGRITIGENNKFCDKKTLLTDSIYILVDYAIIRRIQSTEYNKSAEIYIESVNSVFLFLYLT